MKMIFLIYCVTLDFSTLTEILLCILLIIHDIGLKSFSQNIRNNKNIKAIVVIIMFIALNINITL